MNDLRELRTAKPVQPETVSIEKPASNLASLCLTPELIRLRDVVLRQWRNKEAIAKLDQHGIYPIRQLLFYGPPGNGKTISAQWIAKELDVPLYRIRCEMLVGSYLGKTAVNVANTLDFLSKSGPSVVLFDEIETLFQSRELGGGECSQERIAAMATLWQALDRWRTPQLFIFATNMESKIDPAMLSRFELQLQFEPPTAEQCALVIEYWAEVFHEYGSAEWAPEIVKDHFASFRDLWQRISAIVRHRALDV